MKGFFKDTEIGNSIIKMSIGCNYCDLKNYVHSPCMKVNGEGRLKALLIGECPGRVEDLKGVQFVGNAGDILNCSLKKFGFDIFKDFFLYNSVNCRVMNENGSNRKPTEKEIACCKVNVLKAIENYKPIMIFLLGSSAVSSIYRGRFNELNISRWRGLIIPDPIFGCWVAPLFHPSFILRNKDVGLNTIFESDLKRALKKLITINQPPQFDDYRKNVVILKDYDEIISILDNFPFEDDFSFDYETSNIKPYGSEQRIWCISFSNGRQSYSFPFEYPGFWDEKQLQNIKSLWIELLLGGKGKIAHNLLFEDLWSRIHFDIPCVFNWKMCTMNAAHIEDNRSYYSGLKFQSFINFGVEPYDKEVSKYIDVKLNCKINELYKVDINKLLLYCGLDSLFTYKLKTKFEKLFDSDANLKRAYNFIHQSLITISDIHPVGMRVDEKWFGAAKEKLLLEINDLDLKIDRSKEALKFCNLYDKKFDSGSSKDLRNLLYKVLKLKPIKKTENFNESVDKDSLEYFEDVPICGLILRKRKLSKIVGTYLAQFGREIFDGRIYTSFNLHIPKTYRSSSSNPNFHNIPAHDDEAKYVIRKGLKPSIGNKVMSADYHAIEVKMGACYTKDPILISYENDPNSDMHRDQAVEIFLLPKDKITSEIRYHAKNGFVFPEWYRSWYKNCAISIWNAIKDTKLLSGELLLDHLKKEGIKSVDDFIIHLRKVEERFWNRFNVFREWQEQIVYDYQKTGKIYTFFGFQFLGYMDQNQIVNYPFQSTAFHCLLWSLNHINRIMKVRGYKTKIMSQIHDDILFDLYPPEQDEIISIVQNIMTQKIRIQFDWLIVPMSAEIKLSGIDESWYDLEKI